MKYSLYTHLLEQRAAAKQLGAAAAANTAGGRCAFLYYIYIYIS